MKRRHSDEHESEPPPRSSPSESSSHGEGGMADTETDAGPSQSDAGPSGGGDSAPLPPPPPAKKKRTRTLTTPHQSAVLHALLAQSRFPTTAMREEVGRSIGLSARKVQVWFQNQRQKARRPRSQSAAAPLTRPPQYGAFSNEPSTSSAGMAHLQQGPVPGPSRLSSAQAGYYNPEHAPYARAAYPSSAPGVPLTGPGMPGSAGPYVPRYPPEQLPSLGPPPSSFDPRQGYAEGWSPERPGPSQGYAAGEPHAHRGRSASHASQHGLGINLPAIVTSRGRAGSSTFPPPPPSAPLRRLDEPPPSSYVPPMHPGPRSPASRSGSFHAPLHSSRTLAPLPPLHIPPTYAPQPTSQWASGPYPAHSPHAAPGLSPIAPPHLRPQHSAHSGASPGTWSYTSPIAPAPETSALREAGPAAHARSPSPRALPRRARFDPVRAAQDENDSGGSGSGTAGLDTPTQRTPPTGGS